MIACRFKPTRFKLVSNLDFLVVFSFIIKAVLKFDDQFNGFPKTIHDEFLVLEGSNLCEFDSLFLFG